MADHALITGYLGELARRLPAGVVDELADGLHETFERHLQRGLSCEDAAAAAIADFGPPALVAASFAGHSAGRRAAVRLLATGPIFAVLWGASLVTAQAWVWPVPVALAVCFATVLLMTAGVLAVAASSRQPARCRLAAPASGVMILLDAAMVGTVVLGSVVFGWSALTWPMALAIPASLLRLMLATRALPRIVSS